MSTNHLARNHGVLVALNKMTDAIRHSLFPALKMDALLALVDCTKNIIIRNIRLTESQSQTIHTHCKALQEFCAQENQFRQED